MWGQLRHFSRVHHYAWCGGSGHSL